MPECDKTHGLGQLTGAIKSGPEDQVTASGGQETESP